MVRRLITTYAQLTSERRRQIEEEYHARRAACLAAGLPSDSPETEEEELPEEEEPEAMEEDEPEQEAPGLTMAEADSEFSVTQSDEMTEQQAVLDSIRDEAEVEANRWLIRQRQTEADALFDELEAETEAEEAATEGAAAPEGTDLWLPHIYPPEGTDLWLPHIYPPEGTEIVDISDEE